MHAHRLRYVSHTCDQCRRAAVAYDSSTLVHILGVHHFMSYILVFSRRGIKFQFPDGQRRAKIDRASSRINGITCVMLPSHVHYPCITLRVRLPLPSERIVTPTRQQQQHQREQCSKHEPRVSMLCRHSRILSSTHIDLIRIIHDCWSPNGDAARSRATCATWCTSSV